jgi:predicted AlkP superfamily phosphohydrolase/phosphomutase
MAGIRKVIVVGLDGLEPTIVDALLDKGELPNLSRLRSEGGYSRLATTYPAQTPVAWSTFATSTNPGGHGIFDFISRDPQTYLPNLALNRYERKNVFSPPRAVNLRRGVPVWEVLSRAGVASTILRCPCTFPPETVRGRFLAGMGVPDLCGGLGTSTFFTSADDVRQQENERVVHVPLNGHGPISTSLPGPRHPRTGTPGSFPLTLDREQGSDQVLIRSAGEPATLAIRKGEWSPWLRVKFKMGLLQAVSGMVRFYLIRTNPGLELYASPLNFTPDDPLFPISTPPEYAGELAEKIGTFYTTGMVEDHGGLNNGRLDEIAFLDQCEQVVRERERMMLYELERHRDGLFFCLFDTPDRIQHMFWRFREDGHPANRNGRPEHLKHAIDEHYRRCDAITGQALEFVDDQTLLIVLSDHGFNSFQRGVHLNTWLHDNGFLALRGGLKPGQETGDFFRHVDWEKTQAYALGLAGIYLNLMGREAAGIVQPAQSGPLKADLSQRLGRLVDPERGNAAIRSVLTREQVYTGPYAHESPDLIVNFSEGYRVSWETTLGGIPAGNFEDNIKKWSGDHIIDPALVPGVLFMNRPFDPSEAHIRDLAPTILAALGVPRIAEMEGESILR